MSHAVGDRLVTENRSTELRRRDHVEQAPRPAGVVIGVRFGVVGRPLASPVRASSPRCRACCRSA
ncbi:MAG: hypothetical protein MZW92_47495 [Comamonadaceae bacterium]|nr:hypothetical protein [Comamonadaceae bacterium]